MAWWYKSTSGATAAHKRACASATSSWEDAQTIALASCQTGLLIVENLVNVGIVDVVVARSNARRVPESCDSCRALLDNIAICNRRL